MDKEGLLTEHKELVRRNRMVGSKFWKWSTFILVGIIIVGLYMYEFQTGVKEEKDQVAEKAVAYVNEKLLAGFGTATLNEVTDQGTIYRLDLTLTSTLSDDTQNATLFLTKDGKLLFPSALDLSEFEYEQKEESSEITTVEATPDPILGNQNASLTIIEYSDFECPFCGEAYWTLKLVLEEYADQVNIVYKNFPIPGHENAQKAAEAAECAHLQGHFAAYHDLLFEHQDALDEDALKQYAVDLGLDSEQFNNCLDSGSMAEEVALDKSEGLSAGVSGTPTFFIGETKIEGVRKFSEFQESIEQELTKQETKESTENETA